MKFLITLLLVLNSFVYAYSSNSLLDMKDANVSSKRIVDIGINSNITRQNYRYEKILQDINIENVILPHEILLERRNEIEESCIFDQYGQKSCPIEKYSCSTTSNFVSGDAIRHSAFVTTPKIIINKNIDLGSGSLSVCVDHIAGFYFEKTGNVVKGMLNTKLWTYTNCRDNFNGSIDYQFEISSKTLSDEDSLIIDRLIQSNEATLELTYSSDCLGSGTISAGFGIPNQTNTIGACSAPGAQVSDVDISTSKLHIEGAICPDGYYDNGSDCKKDYVYYTYTCPTNINTWGEEWIGPVVSTGGDCSGNGISESIGGVCPNAGPNPPEDNCRQFSYNCPVGNGDTECVLDSEGATSSSENVINGYVYRIASSEKFSNTLFSAPICPETSNPLYGCDLNWKKLDTDNTKCYKQAEISLETSDCLEYNGVCYKKISNDVSIIEYNNEVVYVKNAILGYDENIGGCISSALSACSDPINEVFDSSSGKCISEPICDVNNISGGCYSRPNKTCPDGYFINAQGNCEGSPNCPSGDIDTFTQINGNIDYLCKNDSAFCSTVGFELDRDVVGTCSKDLESYDGFCGKTNLPPPASDGNICYDNTLSGSWSKTYLNGAIGSPLSYAGNIISSTPGQVSYFDFYYREIVPFFEFYFDMGVDSTCGGESDEIPIAEQRLEDAIIELDNATENLILKTEIYNEKQDDVDTQQVIVDNKLDILNTAEASLTSAEASLTSAEASLTSAEANYNTVVSDVNATSSEISAASSAVSSATDAVSSATDAVNSATDAVNSAQNNYDSALADYLAENNILNNYKSIRDDALYDKTLAETRKQNAEDEKLAATIHLENVRNRKDEDTIGLVFGYEDASNFWALTWSRNINYGGTYIAGGSSKLLTLIRYVNGRRLELGSYSAGWTCGRNASFKIKSNELGVYIYYNGSTAITYFGAHPNKGKLGFMNISMNDSATIFIPTLLKETAQCNDGYFLDYGDSICYKDYGPDKIYDYERLLVFEDPVCTSGTFNKFFKKCVTDSICAAGTSKILNLNQSPICEGLTIESCSNDSTYVLSNHFSDDRGSCLLNNICADKNIININGETKCASEPLLNPNSCPEGYTGVDNFGDVKCVAIKQCPKGYVDNDGVCKLTYNWYEYTCPESDGFSKSNEIFNDGVNIAGGDCQGSCGTDNCDCNSPIAPANSCRKPIIEGASQYVTIQKKELLRHRIVGNTILPEYMNLKLDQLCSSSPENCKESVYKIEGDGNKLCFYLKNGQNSCFNVDSCFFNGTIENTTTYLSNLYLRNPYELTVLSNTSTQTSNDTQYVIIESAPNKGFDYCYTDINVPGPFNFSDFAACPREGVSPASLAIKLSDNKWYALYFGDVYNDGNGGNKSVTGTDRCGLVELDSYFEHLPPENVSILETSSTPGYGLKLRIQIPQGLRLTGFSDYESVISNLAGNLVINGRSVNDWCIYGNRYDEILSFYNENEPNNVFSITRNGSDFEGGENVDLTQLSFNDTYTSSENVIKSSCKMNGFVGWNGRVGPIVSVGNDSFTYSESSFDITGTASEGLDTEWSGFNAATMAIQFNDSDWYILGDVRSINGINVDIEKPSFLKTLPSSYYEISDDNGTVSVCKYKNNLLASGICGHHVKIKTPEKDSVLTKIAPVRYLYTSFGSSIPTDINTTLDNYNLIIEVNGVTQGILSNSNLNVNIDKNATQIVTEDNLDKFVNTRLRFWDPFTDYDIGFIEFVPEVYPNDRADGYIPDLLLYDELLSEGFTSIKLPTENDMYLSTDEQMEIGITYFVKPTPTTTSDCSSLASKYGLIVVNPNNFNVVDQEKLFKTLGFRVPNACILSYNGVEIPSAAKYAIKKQTWSSFRRFVCSPYLCEGISCKVEQCTENTTGTLLPPSYSNSLSCKAQSCDGNRDYVPFCGKQGPCPTGTVEDASGNCIDKTCPSGSTFNNGVCQVLRCPSGTIEHNDGGCYKN